MTAQPLFSKRHYEWLARFAGTYLCSDAYYDLAEALEDTSPNFDRSKFITTVRKIKQESTAKT
jgi:hypothetical protein